MLTVVIILIAAAILVYFAFSGNAEVQPSLTEEKISDSVIFAIVQDKYICEGTSRRSLFPTCMVVFCCDDGENREFVINSSLYDKIAVGERDELVYMGQSFIGFGNHGAVESDFEMRADDGFTLDDYDESIDVEIDTTSPGLTRKSLGPEERKYFDMFLKREMLPAKSESVEDEAPSLSDYSALKLLEKTTLYPFLKRENAVRDMFLKTYNDSMTDLLGYEEGGRTGIAADSEFINKNEIRVAIKIQENPAPLPCRISVEFGVNE